MSAVAELIARGERIDLLRLLTCGSVDDGKSTLIGRLLHDSKTIYEDTLATLASDSRRVGSAGGAIDFSLLLDGLKAEREQGITIDVAYRYFSTPRRKFIIADCPGHEQYTRNMATGASTANLAIVLVDARRGILPQTRRHSFIASLLDIAHVVVAINKMDLVGWSEERFEEIRAAYADFATRLEIRDLTFIPMSALTGDNVVEPSARMPWYRGTPLLAHLETAHIGSDRNLIDLRFPVQHALRQGGDFRGYQGSVASGVLRPGAEVVVLPSGWRTRVAAIHTYEGEVAEAFPPMAVTVTVADELDIGRGDMLVAPNNQPRLAHDVEATLVWMAEAPLDPRRTYRLKHTTTDAQADVAEVRYRFDVETLHRVPAATLALNEIGRVTLRTSRPLAFDPYRRNRATGAFILIDPIGNGTVAAGMILDRAAPDAGQPGLGDQVRATNVRQHASRVTAAERRARAGHDPVTVWLTGLPGAGKSTIAHGLERALFDAGRGVVVLDGENLRLGLSRNLGFSAGERAEHVRRAAHVARLLNEAGLIAIVALVSPAATDRAAARELIGEARFLEVFVDVPAEICEARDPDGTWARARRGEIEHFTGVTAPYERPATPALAGEGHALLAKILERLGI